MNQKQKAFATEYVIDYNATQAAIRAGYSKKTAYSMGQRLLKNVEVKKMIQELEEAASERTSITKDMVLKELAKIAFVDPRKLFDEEGRPKDIRFLDPDTAAALSSVDIYEEFNYNGDEKELMGYKEYKQKVRYKIIPFIW